MESDYDDSLPLWRYEFDEPEDGPYSMPLVNDEGFVMTEEEARADAREEEDNDDDD